MSKGHTDAMRALREARFAARVTKPVAPPGAVVAPVTKATTAKRNGRPGGQIPQGAAGGASEPTGPAARAVNADLPFGRVTPSKVTAKAREPAKL